MKTIYNIFRGYIALIVVFLFFYSVSCSCWFLLLTPVLPVVLTFLTIEIE